MTREQIIDRDHRQRAIQLDLERVDDGCRRCVKFIGDCECATYGPVPLDFVSQGCDECDDLADHTPINTACQNAHNLAVLPHPVADPTEPSAVRAAVELETLAKEYPGLICEGPEDFRTLVFDIECMPNWFFIAFRNVMTGTVVTFEQYQNSLLDIESVRRILQSARLISFNGNHYDLPLVRIALTGADCAMLHAASKALIESGRPHWEVARQFPSTLIQVNHIDLMGIAPGHGSLKLYGGRLHCPTLKDLPFDPHTEVSPGQRAVLTAYCANDLALTVAIYKELIPQIQLRERMSTQHRIDLRSKSDAQIAEAVLRCGVQELSGSPLVRPTIKPGTSFHYQRPAFISFATPALNQVLELIDHAEFVIDSSGSVQLPDSLANLSVPIGSGTYRLGLGGLHSAEVTIAHRSDTDNVIIDRDVISYYPSIILQCDLAPKHMGEHFSTVYRALVEERLTAKRDGDKVVADALKICINGTFGKLGSPWSILYAPDLLITVTITGQLALLMLIEALESNSLSVISANTDGLVIQCPRSKTHQLDAIVQHWERATGFTTDATEYSALYMRDVNNYIAIKTSGEVKTKGAYATDSGLSKNPVSKICCEAVIAHLIDGTPIENAIRGCEDITKFLTLRTVKDGAVKNDQYLGKVIRWYYSTAETGTINYRTKGHKVPRSTGARPLMQLPDVLPTDIDYDWYINEARNMLVDIGAVVFGPAQRDLLFG